MIDVTGITITRAIQTSMACPSQWDAWDAAGNYYYLRFRGGCGQMRQYTTDDWVNAPFSPDGSNPTFVRNVASFTREIPGDPGWIYDGDISLEEFAERAGITLALEDYTGYGDHLRDELIKNGLVFLLEDRPEPDC